MFWQQDSSKYHHHSTRCLLQKIPRGNREGTTKAAGETR